jgi:23S rRNA-/tRNA-specific pseudouridylate synthase
MSECSVGALQALEEAAWASPERRALYSTRYIAGFPWHTVKEVETEEETKAPRSSTPVVRRHVVPYDFPFTVFVKGRWVGRRLLDVYSEELPHHTPAYYEACLRTGRLFCRQRGALNRHNTQRKLLKRSAAPVANTAPTLLPDTKEELQAMTTGHATSLKPVSTPNPTACSLSTQEGLVVDGNVVLQHGDVVYHTVHRHEVPVSVGTSGVDPVCITAVRIAQYGLICVNKPTGLPTHATGRYMYNSLTAILEYVLAPKRLHAWLVQEDALLQSLVSTAGLSAAEKQELYAYYDASVKHDDTAGETIAEADDDEVGEVDPSKLPRPCHRLDKVTSGVVLLAVQQDAARRIGTMLMRKAKEVDEAVTAELSQSVFASCVSDASRASHIDNHSSYDGSAVSSSSSSLSLPTSLRRVVGRTYDMQKYYLARVLGTLESGKREDTSIDTVAARSCTEWQLSGAEACLRHHNEAALHLLRSSSSLRDVADVALTAREGATAMPSVFFPGGVLTIRPIAAHRHAGISEPGEINLTSKAATSATKSTRVIEGSRTPKESSTTEQQHGSIAPDTSTSAATLCQTFCHEAATGAHADRTAPFEPTAQSGTESVVLCTPYTGRLHQLRYHLSSLGCPIVGDVVYRTSTALDMKKNVEHQARLAAGEQTSRTTAPEDADSGEARKERDYIYFDAGKLPNAYRRLCEASDAVSASTAARVGEKHAREEAPLLLRNAPLKSSSASSAWEQEPLCYECAGRLPIVATSECATGTSAICLHAWAYEIKESLLLQSNSSTKQGSAESLHSSPTGTITHVADNVHDTGAELGGARVIDEGFVRFEAAPPAWAALRSLKQRQQQQQQGR